MKFGEAMKHVESVHVDYAGIDNQLLPANRS